MALSMACMRDLRRAAVLRCKIGVWLILSRSRHRRRNWVVASPTSSPRSDDSKALVWFLRRTLRHRFSAVRRTVWRTRFLVDSLLGNAITSCDQWTASFEEASQVLSPKSRPLARGNPKKGVCSGGRGFWSPIRWCGSCLQFRPPYDGFESIWGLGNPQIGVCGLYCCPDFAWSKAGKAECSPHPLVG